MHFDTYNLEIELSNWIENIKIFRNEDDNLN